MPHPQPPETPPVTTPGRASRAWPARQRWAVLALAWLSGCVAGPDYEPPQAPTQTRYLAATASSDAPPRDAQQLVPGLALSGPWWHSLGSPALNALIDQALAASPSLAAAQATLHQAQALQQAQDRTARLPQVDAGIGGQRQHANPAQQGQTGDGRSFDLYSASVQWRWQPDLSGAQRRTLEALTARSEWRRHELDAARQSLAAQLAGAAITRARLAAQIETTQDIAEQQRELADIAERRLALGQALPDEAQALRAQAAQTRASLPALRQQMRQTEHLLTTLAGQAPGVAAPHPFTLAEFTLPAQLPWVVPSQLVRQRPDIQASEALLRAAHAERGATLARRYPQLQLSASLGSQALTTGALFGAGAAAWALGGQLAQPLFNPAQPAHERAADAALQAAAAQYQGVVLQALRQVADALRAIEHDAQALQAYAEADQAAQAAAHTVQQRYRWGAASYAQWLLVRQQATQTRLQREQAHAQRLVSSVALYQALGSSTGAEPIAVQPPRPS